HDGLSVCLISRIDEHSDARGFSQDLAQNLKLLCRQLGIKKIDACQVGAGSRKAADQPELDWVLGGEEHNRNSRRCCLSSKSSANTTARDDYINMPMHRIGRQIWQPIHLVLSPTIFDCYGVVFRVAALLKTSTKSAQAIPHSFNRSGVDK